MDEIFRGIKPRDVILAAALTVAGVLLMNFDVRISDAHVARAIAHGSMYHPMGSHSPWMIPLFAAATASVLWWRRGVIVVIATAIAVMALHDLIFGWVTRCGVGLPLAFVLTFLGALAYNRGRAWLACGLSALLCLAVVVQDSTTGPGAILLALPVVLVVFGIGRAARHRVALNRELVARDAELRQLRDERAALMVAADRAELSRQLDGLLQQRLGQLTAAAESADGLAPAEAKALLASIETESRRTLDDMREIVGVLRGGDLALAPAPTVAHLDALLMRNRTAHPRLTVSGHPRSLPATVELSAYRIVEHLLGVLADHDDPPVGVVVRFADEALEIHVSGLVDKRADVKAAVARAKERAHLLGGSVSVKVTRGHAQAVAQLPVLG